MPAYPQHITPESRTALKVYLRATLIDELEHEAALAVVGRETDVSPKYLDRSLRFAPAFLRQRDVLIREVVEEAARTETNAAEVVEKDAEQVAEPAQVPDFPIESFLRGFLNKPLPNGVTIAALQTLPDGAIGAFVKDAEGQGAWYDGASVVNALLEATGS